MSKLWGGRFSKELDQEVAIFTSSLEIDQRLWPADIQLSLAHAKMLGRQKIISADEATTLVDGLTALAGEIENAFAKGASPFRPEAEDVHSEIERMLREKIGAVAGKLHTARSRNDQVATACRMTIVSEARELQTEIRALQTWLLETAENESKTLLPGLTHFQHAQPVSLAQHLLSYFWMLARDHEKLAQFVTRTLSLPLGAAALAGTSFPIDRHGVAEELGFTNIAENSMDAVSDRDFAVEYLSIVSTLMMHYSRFCEELIIWSSPEFAFVELDDSVTTGSSIMPQKKNPDVAELIRGRTGRAFGALMGLLTSLKGLPMAYNRDLQEDKFFLFQGSDVARSSTRMMLLMVKSIKFNREQMRSSLTGDFSNATDLADDLAKKGLPFREAHEVTGRIVQHCLANQLKLEELELADLRDFHPLIDQTTIAALGHQAVLAARNSSGGTSPSAVAQQISQARKKLSSANSGASN